MRTLAGKTLFITGASRGIGKAIAMRAARDGANIVIAAKSAKPHPTLPGTIYTAAEDIEGAGGKALPLQVDVRFEDQISGAVEKAAEHFGGIDILVNNASAISLTGTLDTSMKRFDLMFNVNIRGSFASAKECLPHLLKGKNPHILNLSPPMAMKPKWFRDHCAYTMSKYGMSMCVLGMSSEFIEQGVAVNALWPLTVIKTSAITMLGGSVTEKICRRPEIVADAAHAILVRDSRQCTGNFFLDEEILREEGVTDFTQYAVDPESPLAPDLFLD
jgi:citronellol/citronellal dehydrogenase